MGQVELQGVSKAFGGHAVIRDVNLTVAEGELVVFVGPSGCGKSTLLRMICGLEYLSGGDVKIDGRSMCGVDPSRREVAMVFQSYALYPHMTVAENMGFALRMAGMSKSARMERVREAARVLRLEDLLDRLPKQLSGGQRQRVAIGRAIVRKPKVFLFDEPLSNLDAELRVQMRMEIASLHRELGATTIYVTHDQVEAMTMADRILVLKGGEVMQIGAPMDLYDRPESLFIAGFIGSPRMNILTGRVRSSAAGRVQIDLPGLVNGPLNLLTATALPEGEEVHVGVRPESLTPVAAGVPTLVADIAFVENLGGLAYLHAPHHPAGPLVIEMRGRGAEGPGRHQVGIDPATCHLFDRQGRCISRYG
jgi:lactose/L-arabinose transport system ATP-binding protein